ncbi:MAG: SsrA-binding protein SmpB [Chloroflexota bacterium]|nr:MAG: SsrA-binding protein SmpB [Chloroflexota bacterium]
MGEKVIATNRKARHEYFLLDTYEAGIVLKGSEIKSIRAGQISLAQAYVSTDGQEVWLMNAHIAPYDEANRFNHEPLRPRKLLLHRKEIQKLHDKVRQKGATIVPLKVYLKNGMAKIEIALARGKKHYDKRAEIAKRDAQRELDRRYKQRR